MIAIYHRELACKASSQVYTTRFQIYITSLITCNNDQLLQIYVISEADMTNIWLYLANKYLRESARKYGQRASGT